jgi:thiamine monophosphate kinase
LNIAERSNCAIDLDLDDMFIPQYIKDVAKEAGVNPWNIVFMWGDWQVIAAIPAELRDDFEIFTAQEGIVYSVFGKASAGRPSVYGSEGDKRRVMNVFRNENFTSGSYNTSVRSHLDYMLHAPIFLEK